MKSDGFDTQFITRGLSRSDAHTVYHNRRMQLLAHCPFPIVIAGIPHPISHHVPWLLTHQPFYQDPLFFYLTGINQPGAILLLNPHAPPDQIATLCLPRFSKSREFWDGHHLGSGSKMASSTATQITGISTIVTPRSLWKHLGNILITTKASSLGLFWNEPPSGYRQIQDHHNQFKRRCRRYLSAHFPNITITNIAPWHYDLRLPLDATDTQLMRTANDITTSAITDIIHALPQCTTEQDVYAVMARSVYQQSWMGFSFPPIIASGKNAQTLHYHDNNAPLPRNGLLLIDMGVRYESMPSDVSRTLPINGTFNPLQAALYTIVLTAQSVVQDAVRPGISIVTLNQLCWEYINTQLDQLRSRITGTLTTPYTTAPHSVSHLIGLAVHDGDPARGYNTMPLKPGMVISNEPGLYVTADLTLDGVHYNESIGIRIEDNLQVTESGCDNLTSCPKTIPDIESLFRSRHTA